MCVGACVTAISDQWEDLRNLFFASDLGFICIYYMKNFSFLSVKVLEIRGGGWHIQIDLYTGLLPSSYDVTGSLEQPVCTSFTAL